MNKKVLWTVVIIVIFIVSLLYIKNSKVSFNIDSSKVSSIEIYFDVEDKKITNKEDINKIVEYFNSLTLSKSSSRPKDATNVLVFKEEKGNPIYSVRFGDSGILWIESKTYEFGSSRINTLKSMINNMGE